MKAEIEATYPSFYVYRSLYYVIKEYYYCALRSHDICINDKKLCRGWALEKYDITSSTEELEQELTLSDGLCLYPNGTHMRCVYYKDRVPRKEPKYYKNGARVALSLIFFGGGLYVSGSPSNLSSAIYVHAG